MANIYTSADQLIGCTPLLELKNFGKNLNVRLLAKLRREQAPKRLFDLAQKAKFSQYELTQEELLQFDSFNRTCLKQLKKKPWYLQLIHQYIYAAY